LVIVAFRQIRRKGAHQQKQLNKKPRLRQLHIRGIMNPQRLAITFTVDSGLLPQNKGEFRRTKHFALAVAYLL